MNTSLNLKHRFPQQTTIPVAGRPPFPDRASFDAHHEAFVHRVWSELAKAGIASCASERGTHRTGGHADVEYFAVRFGDDHGGAELVLYEVDWGGQYVPVTPWVTLFGSWTAHRKALAHLQSTGVD